MDLKPTAPITDVHPASQKQQPTSGPSPAFGAIQSEASLNARVASVKQIILNSAVETVLACSRSQPLALIALGSLGRNEETILLKDGRACVLGDAEFYVVFRSRREAKSLRAALQSTVSRLEGVLQDECIDCKVHIEGVPAGAFKRMPPHILAYELRTASKVLWGDRNILGLIPGFSAVSIPKWDAWRSVANRMIEQLAYADALTKKELAPASELLYRCLKIQLELATMVLHFHGAYQPTYQARALKLRDLAGQATLCRELPWLSELAARVETCTRFKVDPNASSSYRDVFAGASPLKNQIMFVQREWFQVLRLVQSVWLWGAERLVKKGFQGVPDPLAVGLAIARQQDWGWRLCGWLRLILDARSSEKKPVWFSMTRLAILGSPRFLSYAIAAALYFAWPDWANGNNKNADEVAARALRYFPLGSEPSGTCGWLEAVKAVCGAWERYLKPNCA
jgi:hypothetical protein